MDSGTLKVVKNKAEKQTLYIVPTPIGNLDDMVPRAIDILQTVDWIAAEDTRHSAKLLQHFNIATPTLAYHDHNEQFKVQSLIELLEQGKSIALISDAGTPLISDPGYRLVSEARKQGYCVVPIPGACALIAALSASGLPSDRFIFEGFLPAKSAARQKTFEAFLSEPRTAIFYESPHRIVACLADLKEVMGEEKEIVIARELSKRYETFLSGGVAELESILLANPHQVKGEMVLLVRGFELQGGDTAVNGEAEKILRLLIDEGLPLKQAAGLAAKITGDKKNRLYKWALGENLTRNQK